MSDEQTDSGDHEAATRALFREIALERQGYYDAKPGGPPRLSFWQQRMRSAVLAVLDRRFREEASLRRVLDAGCGRGDFTLQLALRYPQLATIVGSDFSPEILALAGAGARAASKVGFAAGDVAALPFAPASFDATVCLNVLHHVRTERLDTALGQLANVTSRVLLLEIKNATSPYFRMHSKRVEGLAVFPVTIARTEAGLRPHGFRLARRHPVFGVSWLSPIVLLHFERR